MILSERNLKQVWYALYTGEEELRDADGFLTGEHKITYSDPVDIMASVSPSSGYYIVEGYTRKMIVDDMTCPIDIHSVLWIDIDTSHKYNYTVQSVSKGIDYISYILKETE